MRGGKREGAGRKKSKSPSVPMQFRIKEPIHEGVKSLNLPRGYVSRYVNESLSKLIKRKRNGK